MKYAAVVLRNTNTPPSAVGYDVVVSALLSGGVVLDEIVLLPYDDANAVLSAMQRLHENFGGVFVICDSVLLPVAREAVSAAAGTAFDEGDLLKTEKCLFAVLSADGSGAEIARSQVVPAANERRGRTFYNIVIKTVFAPPKKVMAAVKLALEEAAGKLAVHTSEQFGIGRIEIVYDQNTPKVVTDEVVRILASALNEHIYAMEDVGIAERLVDALKLHGLHIATAESFTGGGVGRAIVSVPGASKVFYEGLNTYDERSKTARLGVKEYTLKTKGAVSSETAHEMAHGLMQSGCCDLAVATTGIAGPDSDGSGTPAGKCFIAVGTKGAVRVYEYQLEGDRETVTKLAINIALFQAYKEIR